MPFGDNFKFIFKFVLMCICLLYVCVSKLADALKMGNKPNRFDTNKKSYHGCKNQFQVRISKDDYLPMTRSMRGTLLNRKRIHRVVPRPVACNDCIVKVEDNTNSKTVDFDAGASCKGKVLNDENQNDEQIFRDSCYLQNSYTLCKYLSDKAGVLTPIVTVEKSEINLKSLSLPNNKIEDKACIGLGSQDGHLRKCLLTNRQFSLIDLNTCLGKSEFTLDLEKKLRKSKRVLGFDENSSDWKEFSYKGKSNTCSRSMKENTKKEMFKRNTIEKARTNLFQVSNPLNDNRPQNCQVLGLCSIGKPQAFLDKTKLNTLHNAFHLNKRIPSCQNVEAHHKGKISNCDICTLEFLTDMNFHHGGKTTTIETQSDKGQCKNVRSNNVLDKNIRIINNNDGNACIDVKVKQQSPPNTTSVISSSPMLSRKTSYDYTNAHIRNMFRYSNSPDVEEIYKNPSCEEPSVGNIPSKLGRPSLHRCVAKKSTSRKLSHRSSKNKCALSSTSTSSSFVSSSSLSTIISYKRVRRIFKTIIEGKQVKRHNKIEISKFKEMEELGLGKLINNRWQPSEYKALSIWREMHENVQGLRGEFIKCHKPNKIIKN